METEISTRNCRIALTVSIVICTRNRPALLKRCLATVSRLTLKPDEVIVIDNSDGDFKTELVAREFSAQYAIERIPGLSRARNRGLAECKTDIVAYLDDDSEPDVGWLEMILAPFHEEQIAVSTGKTFPLEWCGEANRDVSPRLLSNRDPHWFEIATFGGLGIGCNMALRRAACLGWKVFDERLGRGAPFHIGEETCAFAHLLSRGYSAIYLPSAIVYHRQSSWRCIELEARSSIAYWWLLFSEFPNQRLNLLRFLFQRLLRKRLNWPREMQDPGKIISSGWRVYMKASIGGTLLFLRTKKPSG
jgi:glycosyltransferase involved in cell wall biosynthesis